MCRIFVATRNARAVLSALCRAQHIFFTSLCAGVQDANEAELEEVGLTEQILRLRGSVHLPFMRHPFSVYVEIISTREPVS